MFMYLRNTFGDTLKENIDTNNLTDSLSKMLDGFVRITCRSHVHRVACLYLQKPVGYKRI